MVGIQRVDGVPEPANAKRAGAREKGAAPGKTAVNPADDVIISREAQEAASTAQVVATAGAPSVIQAERIAEARQNLAQNTYKVMEIVEQVAARITDFL